MIKNVIIFFVGLLVLGVVIKGAANWLNHQPSQSESRFEVIDNYKGCNVVRYSPDYAARYFYFLECK